MKLSTNCVEKPIRSALERLGRFVGCHPWWFTVIPLLLSVALGVGFYFLEDRKLNEIVEQFTPRNGQAKMEKQFFETFFQQNRDLEDDTDNDGLFSALRLTSDGSYASVIFTSGPNVLAVDVLEEILHVNDRIRNMTTQFEGQTLSYRDVCALVKNSCYENALLKLLDYRASNVEEINLTFPVYQTYRLGPIHLQQSIGQVQVDQNGTVQSAKAVRLLYYLRQNNSMLENAWLNEFLRLISNESTSLTRVSYFTSISRQQEFEKSTESVTQLFAITYVIAIVFSVLSCIRFDNVRNKVCVAFLGVISAGLAVLSSFGLLLFMDVPFVITVASSPFLVLGIGIDDMFIMISCWQQTGIRSSVPERLAATYREAAISITITTLTDVLAFFLSYSSPFRSVQSFCLYAGTAVLFCYLYNVTFFGACLALNGEREESDRHWFTCRKVPQENPAGASKGYALCCVGGAYSHEHGTEEEHPMTLFFRKVYGPLLTTGLAKAVVVFLYIGYVSVSVYGCTKIKEGLDLKNLAVDRSYVVRYYEDEKAYFACYGPVLMLAVNATFPYWERTERAQLDSCIAKIQGLPHVASLSASWLHSYERYAERSDLVIDAEGPFKEHLRSFLEHNPTLRLDLNTSDGAIRASRLFLQTGNVTSYEKETLESVRRSAQSCPVPLVVYHPAFIYYDQYAVILSDTVQTLGIATATMLLVALMLIPSPVCALWVAFAIASVVVGVSGCMGLLGISLDSISMINLIIGIGFAVDFSAHVSYAFVSSAESGSDRRAVEALAHLGYPILQGALSTVLGVVVLSASVSYIFRTFFTVTLLVISFGLLHSIVFIPVFLTFSGFCIE